MLGTVIGKPQPHRPLQQRLSIDGREGNAASGATLIIDPDLIPGRTAPKHNLETRPSGRDTRIEM